jgi:Cdc6-like AAA superfamily ATPase
MVSGFFAYPDGSSMVSDAINGAVELTAKQGLLIKPWREMRIIGFKLDKLVRDQIRDADLLAADITIPNHNVLYEIGYAIAIGKPVVPTVNTAIEKSVEGIQRIGLFDTIGWAPYDNASELAHKLGQWNDVSWRNQYSRRRNHSQPLFILDTLKKTDFRNHIFHAVDNSQVNYRKFDPDEIPRLTAAQAIAEVSSSAGVIVPILSDQIVDHYLHNLRAAFILGLAHGYGTEALAIQYENGPAPLDYRDFITNSTYRKETENHVERFCAETLIWNQRLSDRDRQAPAGLLGQIDLGSPAAENEMQQLGYYFVKTAEFSRALRAEGAVVTGRKGSGKSAVFLQVVETVARDRALCIVDLRPASHNLSEMREALLSVVNAGVFDHTIAAFWQYIIYVEVLLKVREMVLPRARNDFKLQERIRDIEESFSLTESMVAGDFTSRLEAAVRHVVGVAKKVENAAELRTQLTNMMFENPIPKLRDAIVSFQDHFSGILVLIDDLDKGWPPRKVEIHDVVTVKHLVEVLNRIQRDLTRRKLDFRHLVFLRSDIYERLVEETSDRGKYNRINLDWSDAEQLRHLLKQRVNSAIDPSLHDAAWAALNPPMGKTDAIGRMIESSLRRPRFLIDLCERTLSFAINRGHKAVDEEDVEEGMRQMSLYLVSDFAYEMRDVAGTPEDLFYDFIGCSDLLTEVELSTILSTDTLGLGVKETIDLLLWYGFLGIVSTNNEPIFIYDRAYDFRRLEAERAPRSQDALYAINPAFLRGLRRT